MVDISPVARLNGAERASVNPGAQSNHSIQELLMTVKAGRGVVAHGQGKEDDLAAFLIGAGYRAYYGFGGWVSGRSNGGFVWWV
jgi:hypothetical protein